MNQLWNDLAGRGKRTLDESQHVLLGRYLDALALANQRMNLTRIVDRAAAEVQHVGDALTILPFLPEGPFSLADVGTGAGVPGIPLAIARPDARITLIEATAKKAAFLQLAVNELALANVTVVNSRAEDVGQGKLRESFDVAVARAVAMMEWLAEWCLPLVKVGGSFLALKGQQSKAMEELKIASRIVKAAGASAAEFHEVQLPGAEHRIIVELRKLRRSDRRMPRAASVAKGKPFAV